MEQSKQQGGQPGTAQAAHSAIGTDFAAAVGPVSEHTIIRTDSDGLLAGEVSVMAGDRAIPVYRARPEGKSNLPVVLVVSEIFGVHAHIADVARRFAKLGYLALAPALFVRQGDPMSFASVAELVQQLISAVPDAQVISDLDACVAWAGMHGGDTGKLAVTGFCWGGRITWLYCAHNPAVNAGVAWYGKLIGKRTELSPLSALDIAADLKVPVLGLYGGKDEAIPVDTVEEMKAALAKGGNRSEFVIYPDAGHAFHADYRPAYAEADAKDSWLRCLDWLCQHGVV